MDQKYDWTHDARVIGYTMADATLRLYEPQPLSSNHDRGRPQTLNLSGNGRKPEMEAAIVEASAKDSKAHQGDPGRGLEHTLRGGRHGDGRR